MDDCRADAIPVDATREAAVQGDDPEALPPEVGRPADELQEPRGAGQVSRVFLAARVSLDARVFLAARAFPAARATPDAPGVGRAVQPAWLMADSAENLAKRLLRRTAASMGDPDSKSRSVDRVTGVRPLMGDRDFRRWASQGDRWMAVTADRSKVDRWMAAKDGRSMEVTADRSKADRWMAAKVGRSMEV